MTCVTLSNVTMIANISRLFHRYLLNVSGLSVAHSSHQMVTLHSLCIVFHDRIGANAVCSKPGCFHKVGSSHNGS